MNDPHVSVIVTTRNRRERVQRAIGSVLAQTYVRFDLHIVDDASEDDTQAVLETMAAQDDRVSYWRHENRRGLSAARNTGMAKSTGDYLAFLDDDDQWKPDCLAKRVDLLTRISTSEHGQLGVVYCGCEIRHPSQPLPVHYNMPKIVGDIRRQICAADLYTIPSSCLFRRAALEHVGGYDESLVSSVDHDIWMSLAVSGYHAYAVRESLVITHDARNRRSMVTDVTPRIRGVEQYLAKWTETFEQWHGRVGARRYIRRYRTRVLGGLSGRKLSEGDWHNAWRLARHVMARNRWALSDTAKLSFVLGRCATRAWLPAPLVRALKSMVKPNHAPASDSACA